MDPPLAIPVESELPNLMLEFLSPALM